jgi:hypothetical protein
MPRWVRFALPVYKRMNVVKVPGMVIARIMPEQPVFGSPAGARERV